MTGSRSREWRYAVVDVRYSNGLSAAALDAQGHPIAVVNVWGIERRVPEHRFAALGEAASKTAQHIAGRLNAND